MPYYYDTGQDVRVGDEIVTGSNRRAVITDILLAGTEEAKAWGLPKGGIMVEEDWGGRPNAKFYPAGPDMLEEFVFVKRGQEKEHKWAIAGSGTSFLNVLKKVRFSHLRCRRKGVGNSFHNLLKSGRNPRLGSRLFGVVASGRTQ